MEDHVNDAFNDCHGNPHVHPMFAGVLNAAVRPGIRIGNEISNRPATPDEACGWVKPGATYSFRTRVRPVTAPEQKELDGVLDDFGIGNPTKPPDGKGVPSAPSPFADQFGETFAPGMIVEPCLRPGDHYVVALVTPERMTVIPCGGGVVFTVTPEAVKFWRLSATRSAERPERDPEDIATQILALIEERTLNRVEVRGLVMKLLRCCA